MVYRRHRLRSVPEWSGVPGVPSCPHAQGCSCTDANTNASEYSTAYKTFLSNYFTAQVFLVSSIVLTNVIDVKFRTVLGVVLLVILISTSLTYQDLGYTKCYSMFFSHLIF